MLTEISSASLAAAHSKDNNNSPLHAAFGKSSSSFNCDDTNVNNDKGRDNDISLRYFEGVPLLELQAAISSSTSTTSSSSCSVPKIVLLRGLPGMGKSYLGARICTDNEGIQIETDAQFMVGGEYVYDPSKIGAAHEACQGEARELMSILKAPLIVVSNTFTQQWEMEAYKDLAIEYGYQVIVVDMLLYFIHQMVESCIGGDNRDERSAATAAAAEDNNNNNNVLSVSAAQCSTFVQSNPPMLHHFLSQLAARNAHGVPEDKLSAMCQRYMFSSKIVRVLNTHLFAQTGNTSTSASTSAASAAAAATAVVNISKSGTKKSEYFDVCGGYYVGLNLKVSSNHERNHSPLFKQCISACREIVEVYGLQCGSSMISKAVKRNASHHQSATTATTAGDDEGWNEDDDSLDLLGKDIRPFTGTTDPPPLPPNQQQKQQSKKAAFTSGWARLHITLIGPAEFKKLTEKTEKSKETEEETEESSQRITLPEFLRLVKTLDLDSITAPTIALTDTAVAPATGDGGTSAGGSTTSASEERQCYTVGVVHGPIREPSTDGTGTVPVFPALDYIGSRAGLSANAHSSAVYLALATPCPSPGPFSSSSAMPPTASATSAVCIYPAGPIREIAELRRRLGLSNDAWVPHITLGFTHNDIHNDNHSHSSHSSSSSSSPLPQQHPRLTGVAEFNRLRSELYSQRKEHCCSYYYRLGNDATSAGAEKKENDNKLTDLMPDGCYCYCPVPLSHHPSQQQEQQLQQQQQQCMYCGCRRDGGDSHLAELMLHSEVNCVCNHDLMAGTTHTSTSADKDKDKDIDTSVDTPPSQFITLDVRIRKAIMGDDATYRSHPVLQTLLPRGLCFLQHTRGTGGAVYKGLFSLRKFFGKEGVEDDGIGLSARQVDFKLKNILKKTESLVLMEKVNGRAASCRFFRFNKKSSSSSSSEYYVIIGTKLSHSVCRVDIEGGRIVVPPVCQKSWETFSSASSASASSSSSSSTTSERDRYTLLTSNIIALNNVLKSNHHVNNTNKINKQINKGSSSSSSSHSVSEQQRHDDDDVVVAVAASSSSSCSSLLYLLQEFVVWLNGRTLNGEVLDPREMHLVPLYRHEWVCLCTTDFTTDFTNFTSSSSSSAAAALSNAGTATDAADSSTLTTATATAAGNSNSNSISGNVLSSSLSAMSLNNSSSSSSNSSVLNTMAQLGQYVDSLPSYEIFKLPTTADITQQTQRSVVSKEEEENEEEKEFLLLQLLLREKSQRVREISNSCVFERNSEGKVLYFLNADGHVLDLMKYKTWWYIWRRSAREIVNSKLFARLGLSGSNISKKEMMAVAAIEDKEAENKALRIDKLKKEIDAMLKSRMIDDTLHSNYNSFMNKLNDKQSMLRSLIVSTEEVAEADLKARAERSVERVRLICQECVGHIHHKWLHKFDFMQGELGDTESFQRNVSGAIRVVVMFVEFLADECIRILLHECKGGKEGNAEEAADVTGTVTVSSSSSSAVPSPAAAAAAATSCAKVEGKTEEVGRTKTEKEILSELYTEFSERFPILWLRFLNEKQVSDSF